MTYESAIFWAVIAWLLCRIIDLIAAMASAPRVGQLAQVVVMVWCLWSIMKDGLTGKHRAW